MTDLLTRLYSGEHYRTPFLSKKQVELTEQLLPYCESVQRWFGMDFQDRMSELQGEISEISQENAFADGFRLSAQLMLEALTPPSGPS